MRASSRSVRWEDRELLFRVDSVCSPSQPPPPTRYCRNVPIIYLHFLLLNLFLCQMACGVEQRNLSNRKCIVWLAFATKCVCVCARASVLCIFNFIIRRFCDLFLSSLLRSRSLWVFCLLCANGFAHSHFLRWGETSPNTHPQSEMCVLYTSEIESFAKQ